MNGTDWVMLGLYIVISVIALVRIKSGNFGYEGTGIKIVAGIGFLVSVYLIVRHPWYCLIWFCLGSVISIVTTLYKLKRT